VIAFVGPGAYHTARPGYHRGAVAATILIVEDEAPVARGIQFALQQEGYDVHIARSGAEGLEYATTEAPDLVVLDVRLPELDGFEVLRRLRATGSKAPVLMLTARDDEFDKVVGLELGADDYLTKPFSLRELAVRVKAILRRVERIASPSSSEPIVRGGLTVDPARRRVTVDGAEVALTPLEFDILLALARDPGVVFTREQLMDRVWGYRDYAGGRVVDSHVARIRRKLGEDGLEPRFVRTVHGVGYAFQGER
jgi:DNA-binding response OmpR family regulator